MLNNMTLSIQIAKFKFRQYQLTANLMLAKITRYTVAMPGTMPCLVFCAIPGRA